MNYIQCDPSNATHVRIIDNDENLLKQCNMTKNKIYPIYQNTEKGFEGEEMILSDDGKTYNCSFSLYLNIEWLKEE